jgi:ElaB/YqjD/DUF883 family membrane-anchored ribosome-binding protein
MTSHVIIDAHPRGSFEGKIMATTSNTTSTKKAAKPKAAPKKPRAKAASSANGGTARAKFSKAIEEARAGAQALSKEAQAKAGVYKEQITAKSGDWAGDAKEYADQAKVKAKELAVDGKARASDAIAGLGKVVSDNAGTIDEKLGTRYGDYARTAARSMQETAAKLEAKELGELGDDAKDFVRKSPGLAIGIAAVAGFLLARLFTGSSDD